MINNYKYFIALAEEKNISRAAEKLFISHQCLSKYLKNLEQHYHVTLFERTPQLTITPAAEALLSTFRKIEILEMNLDNQLDDIRQSKRGLLRFSTTEGRYRILVPGLPAQFKKIYTDVTLDVSCATSEQLTESLHKNELDIVMLNQNLLDCRQLNTQFLLDEELYLVISENMLAQYFPEQYPKFKDVPFVINCNTFYSRKVLDSFMQKHNIQLKCVTELMQLDIHFMIAAHDYAACFCWSMYIPSIYRINRDNTESPLHVFHIRQLNAINHIVLATKKGKILPAYGQVFIVLIKKDCSAFSQDMQKEAIR